MPSETFLPLVTAETITRYLTLMQRRTGDCIDYVLRKDRSKVFSCIMVDDNSEECT